MQAPVRSRRPLLLIAGAAAIAWAERRHPLRTPTQPGPRRLLGNLVLGITSLAVVSLLEAPVVVPLARSTERRRSGVAQRLPLPPLARDLIAVLLMDYTIYVWHVLTHKVPPLWRLHLVHHIDLDLDASTALRFHAVDMAVSVPWRAAQVALLGVSPRALGWWQGFFFLSVLFHHGNIRLPPRLDRALSRILTTPRMHGIHHSASRDRTASNWSSGLSLWDHLHRTWRLDEADSPREIGVVAYRNPSETCVAPSLTMPFRRQRDAWHAAPRTAPGA